MLAASIMALHRNLPLTDLDGFVKGETFGTGMRPLNRLSDPSACKVLVLDDSLKSGAQLREVKRKIQAAGLDSNVLYAAVYVVPSQVHLVDIALEALGGHRVFEWNIMHKTILKSSCMDFDGVLCRDPTAAENDDGVRYLTFLETVEPLVVPSVPIGWIVTCRLEKYREASEHWLAKHGVRYERLIMMDLPSKEARVAAKAHGPYKADVYARTGAKLFIESSERQAAEIARLSHKPVYCFQTATMYQGSRAVDAVNPYVVRLKRVVKRLLHRCGVQI
jgi:orotate phosphoribosyltransferase